MGIVQGRATDQPVGGTRFYPARKSPPSGVLGTRCPTVPFPTSHVPRQCPGASHSVRQGLSFLHVPVWAAVYRVLTIAKWPAASHLSCNNCVPRLMNLLTVAVSYTLGRAVGKLGFWQGEESLCSVL